MDAGGTDQPSRAGRYIGVGCFMMVAGFFSGGMIGVFVGKLVGMARRCVPDPGLPVCDWHVFFFAGGILSAIALPAVVLWRLRQSTPSAEQSDRG